ncbi:hypothetical protein EZ313_14005 [Ramlibacter henchirensis]|uniref:Uncharacterized protein n=1 Tax=Ramlibacter henchirensis TaxID=204072 RepID=A0A4Z0BSV1_9BURK|nr:hypothetical protein [Ramlibacter henchirensis]TFZ02377.1 hypothetical protein EZ313_14005 [Ramlibacter henchirensis]
MRSARAARLPLASLELPEPIVLLLELLPLEPIVLPLLLGVLAEPEAVDGELAEPEEPAVEPEAGGVVLELELEPPLAPIDVPLLLGELLEPLLALGVLAEPLALGVLVEPLAAGVLLLLEELGVLLEPLALEPLVLGVLPEAPIVPVVPVDVERSCGLVVPAVPLALPLPPLVLEAEPLVPLPEAPALWAMA